jgi:hypothetical protein
VAIEGNIRGFMSVSCHWVRISPSCRMPSLIIAHKPRLCVSTHRTLTCATAGSPTSAELDPGARRTRHDFPDGFDLALDLDNSCQDHESSVCTPAGFLCFPFRR